MKGKTNPEVKPTDNFIASVDLLLILLKFLLQHSKSHWPETNFIVRNQNVYTSSFDQSLLFKAEVAPYTGGSWTSFKGPGLEFEYYYCDHEEVALFNCLSLWN